MTRVPPLVRLALLGALLAGCGGGDEPVEPGQAPEAALELPEPLEVREWSADANPLQDVEGRLTLGGEAVAGARIRVGDYRLWSATDEDGRFRYPLDVTLPRHYPVSVASAEDATIDGEALSSDQLAALEEARGSIAAAHRLDEVAASADQDGIAITGRVTIAGEPAEPVALYAYELTGTVTDAEERPVEGAIVSTRTTDRDFWTFSDPSGRNGRYTSNFAAADRIGSNPVPITAHVAVGDETFAFQAEETVLFERLRSAEMNIHLPPKGFPLALPQSRSFPGARYKGVVVGAQADGRTIRPVRVTWPDDGGSFELVLPDDLAGETVSLWAGELELFSRRDAKPGRPIDLVRWPTRLPPDLPVGLAEVELPSE